MWRRQCTEVLLVPWTVSLPRCSDWWTVQATWRHLSHRYRHSPLPRRSRFPVHLHPRRRRRRQVCMQRPAARRPHRVAAGLSSTQSIAPSWLPATAAAPASSSSFGRHGGREAPAESDSVQPDGVQYAPSEAWAGQSDRHFGADVTHVSPVSRDEQGLFLVTSLARPRTWVFCMVAAGFCVDGFEAL